jgi:hypothetical protein
MHPPSPAGGRPGFAQRHRILLILAVFAATLAAALGIQWRQLLGEARDIAHQNAQHLTAVFQEQLESGIDLSGLLDALDDPRTYDFLLERSRYHLRGLGLAKVKFFDRDGRVILAEDRSLLGQDHSGKELLQQAIRGQTVSKLVRPREYTDMYGGTQYSSLVETYTPVRGAGGRVTHVLEVYQNFDADLARARRLLGWSALQLAAVLAVALGAVLYLQRRVEGLEHEVDTLESFLPICAYCKKIRVETEGEPDHWVAVDHYLMEREMAEFSHGICEDCLKIHFPEDG